MAQKKLEKVELASVKDIDAFESQITKISNQGMASAKKAYSQAEKINSILSDARRSIKELDASRKTLNRLYFDLRDGFKNLGIEMPKELNERFNALEDTVAQSRRLIGERMTNTKNVIQVD